MSLDLDEYNAPTDLELVWELIASDKPIPVDLEARLLQSGFSIESFPQDTHSIH